MKILMPCVYVGDATITSNKISDGTQRVYKMFYDNIPNIIIYNIRFGDRYERGLFSKIANMALENDVDIVISHYENPTFTIKLQKLLPDIPVLCIVHTSGRTLANIFRNKTLYELKQLGGSIFMVSEHQYKIREEMFQRIEKQLLPVDGYIDSGCCTGNEFVSNDILYEAVTVGRQHLVKDPFFLHRKSDSIIHSLVLTSLYEENQKKHNNQVYLHENQNWQYPQETLYNLPHNETMDYLSKSGVFVSTWSDESWGITALEGLSHGCPLFLVTNSSNTHASECIPASTDHYIKIKRTIKQKDFVELVRKYQLPYEQRVEISEMTKEKNTLERWKNNVLKCIDKTIDNHKNHKKKSVITLDSFFDSTIHISN